jgi:hypothetical protein
LDFVRVVDTIARFLEREGKHVALAGAFALHAYGLSRATFDLDFVTESAVRERLVAFLESLGYETLHSSEGYSNHLHRDPAMGRVDFVYVAGDTSRRLFASPGTVLRIGGREVPVPRAEHLAAMKVHAMKNDPGRSLQEMADIRFLLEIPGVDRDEIRGYFEKAGLRERYDEIQRSLEGD